MNLYNVTLWDPDYVIRGKVEGGYAYLSIVAPTAEAALREVKRHKGEITAFKLQQSGLIVV